MNQRTLYFADTYLLQVKTTVFAAGTLGDDGRQWVAVQDNIAHPQGGGQPADQVRLDGVDVVPTWSHTQAGSLVVLALPSAAQPPAVGEVVTVDVDEQTRLLHAALHTAGHIVDAVVRRRGFTHLVSNHFPGQARIEFSAEHLSESAVFVQQIHDEVIAHAARHLPTSSFDGQEGRRMVSIGDLSTDQCGGTHVGNTAELREVLVRAAKVKKGRLKVSYTAAHLTAAPPSA